MVYVVVYVVYIVLVNIVVVVLLWAPWVRARTPARKMATATIYTTHTTTYTIPYHPCGGPRGLRAQGAASNMDMKSKQGKNRQNKQKLLDVSQNVSQQLNLFILACIF